MREALEQASEQSSIPVDLFRSVADGTLSMPSRGLQARSAAGLSIDAKDVAVSGALSGPTITQINADISNEATRAMAGALGGPHLFWSQQVERSLVELVAKGAHHHLAHVAQRCRRLG